MAQASRCNHAIVIGGSIAGLLTARVLSDFFERVTVLDRDALDDNPLPRKGVPQSSQFHAILSRSYVAVCELFPGLVEDMANEGATMYDSGLQMAATLNGCWVMRGANDLKYIAATRPYYELKIRRRIQALPNVTVHARRLVQSLAPGGNGGIAGVEIEDVATGERQRIDGNLVVDASGRATKSPRWLEALGFGVTPVEEVEIDLTYVGALYEASPGFRPAACMYVIYPDPPRTWCGGLLQPVEGRRWKVSQWGMFGDRAPLDDSGFIAFSRSLASGELHDFLRNARRLTDLKPMKIPLNRWHRYDRMPRFPENYCIVGDAVSSLNPIYGQGMTKAAIHAMYLRKLLQAQAGQPAPAEVATRLRRELPAAVERQAWMTTVYGDLVYPQAKGHRPPDFRFVTWYTRCVGELASIDIAARHAYQRALCFEDGMYAFFRPQMFAKVLAHAVRRRFVPRDKLVNTGPMPLVE